MGGVVRLSFGARRLEEVERGSGVIVMVLVSTQICNPPKRHDKRGKENQKNKIREKEGLKLGEVRGHSNKKEEC